jgi:hypothetical protein
MQRPVDLAQATMMKIAWIRAWVQGRPRKVKGCSLPRVEDGLGHEDQFPPPRLRRRERSSVGMRSPAHVTISGTPKEFTRAAASGGKVHTYFCPNCGSTIYWKADNLPGHPD